MRNTIPIMLICAISMSCSTAPVTTRSPSSAGAEGNVGQVGSRGQNGQDGSVIVAQGCESFAIQSIAAMHDSYSAKQWVANDGDLEWMCGRDATTSISAASTEKMHNILDEKIGNLLASGYFKPAPVAIDGFPRTMDGLKAKVGAVAALFEELEKKPKRDFPCVVGNAQSDGHDLGKMKICFNSELRYINANGKIETTVAMLAFRQQKNGSFDDFRTSEERVPSYVLPETCPGGGVSYKADDHGRSMGRSFEHKINASCKTFESTYSAIYPSFVVNY